MPIVAVRAQLACAERIRANAAIFDFELDAAAMARIDALDAGLNVSVATLSQGTPWAEVA